MSKIKISYPLCFDKVEIEKKAVKKNNNNQINNFYNDKLFSTELFYKKIIKL
jgi:hypothetical protein